jgi:hypothetical protein
VVGARVLVVEAVYVCHEEEVVCVDHGGCYGGEGVVVAEFDFLGVLVVVFMKGVDERGRRGGEIPRRRWCRFR